MEHIKEKKNYNILFCGIGGQGVLTASEICGWAALYDGFEVKKSEVHGMSQRGGSVESHLRFGYSIYSPLIPEGMADFLVPFYKDEHDRWRFFLKEEGIDLIEFLLKAENEIQDKKLINTYILGILSRYLPIKEEYWIKSIEKVLTKMLDKNKDIFLKARSL